jgi:Dodecin
VSDSVYRVTEVIGVSDESWESAARSAVETAAQSVREGASATGPRPASSNPQIAEAICGGFRPWPRP